VLISIDDDPELVPALIDETNGPFSLDSMQLTSKLSPTSTADRTQPIRTVNKNMANDRQNNYSMHAENNLSQRAAEKNQSLREWEPASSNTVKSSHSKDLRTSQLFKQPDSNGDTRLAIRFKDVPMSNHRTRSIQAPRYTSRLPALTRSESMKNEKRSLSKNNVSFNSGNSYIDMMSFFQVENERDTGLR
jgi:hypothetical protein